MENDEGKDKPDGSTFLRVCVMYYLVCMGDAARGVVLPTMVKYYEWMLWGPTGAPTGDTTFLSEYSVALTAFSLGRALFAPFQGYVADTSGPKVVLVVNTLLFSFSNLLYACCYDLGTGPLVVLLCTTSRFLMGGASGQLGVLRAYVSDMVTAEDRVKYLSYLNLVQFVGFTLTAFVGGAFEFSTTVCGISFNMYTMPGFVLFVAGLLGVFGLLFAFPDAPVGRDSPGKKQGRACGGNPLADFDTTLKIAVVVLLLLNMVLRANLAVFENLGTYIAMTWFHLNESSASTVYTMIGLAGIGAFFLIDPMKKCLKTRGTATLGYGLMCVGNVMFFYYAFHSFVAYLAGFAMVWSFGYPIAQTMLLVIFANVLGSKKKATLMGILGVFGSIGRIIAPLWTAPLPDHLLWIAFMIPFCITAGSLVVLCIMWDMMHGAETGDDAPTIQDPGQTGRTDVASTEMRPLLADHVSVARYNSLNSSDSELAKGDSELARGDSELARYSSLDSSDSELVSPIIFQRVGLYPEIEKFRFSPRSS